jgi:tetratricopeptide (TPR) repeat protein
LAEACCQLDLYEEAIDHCLQADAVAPDSAEAARSLARLYGLVGDACVRSQALPTAETAYRRAVELDPSRDGGWFDLGAFLSLTDNHEEAVLALARSTSINQDNADAWFWLGSAHRALGRPHSAIRDYERALALEPKDVASLHNLGLTLFDIGEYKLAAEVLLRGLQLSPEDPDLHYCLGACNDAMGDSERAIWHYRQVVKTQRENFAVWRLLEDLLFEQGSAGDSLDARLSMDKPLDGEGDS